MRTLAQSILSLWLLATTIVAGEVQTRLSSREAYVGDPVVLEISIIDTTRYEPPTVPDIDGCEVRSAGAPAMSSQLTNINGRWSQSQTITLQYLIRPLREGRFQIPPMPLTVDGEQVETEPMEFVATKSVTGDLLFVEIEGGKDKVYVGQPLDLKLKIWLKPYRDQQRGIVLSEGDMWSMISERSSWGSFTSRMEEMAANNQRPSGNEVLREDGAGNQRSYYLYQIEATIYPKRPGKIAVDDVRIIADYPVALGKARSPFGSLFEDGPFGGNSPFPNMMDDEFFDSPFANRLAVIRSRPIEGDIRVDATEVIPTPTAGRPADYRGAVGRYQIVTQASPTTVDAGDPITLNIGIAGTGPMELVQAPPLSQQSELTADFKVADESLAGFIKGDSKLFSTTLRPRTAGITAIPPVRFSFFDPDLEQYVTVASEPIAIRVKPADTLALDSIVADSPGDSSSLQTQAPSSGQPSPDFTNQSSAEILESQTVRSTSPGLWVFMLAPPLVCLFTWLACHRKWLANSLMNFRSHKLRCIAAINGARDMDAIASSLIRYIADRTGRDCQNVPQAMGALRVAGMSSLANELERFLSASTTYQSPGSDPRALLSAQQEKAMVFAEQLDVTFAANRPVRLRPSDQSKLKPSGESPASRLLGLLLAMGISLTQPTFADEGTTLTPSQAKSVLAEADSAYGQGLAAAKADSANAKERFQAASDKYQLLVDSGIRNGPLYGNLANAYIQSGELGKAIVNYERSLQLESSRRQSADNLRYAYAQVIGQASVAPSNARASIENIFHWMQNINARIVRRLGSDIVSGVTACASLVFWGLLTIRATGRRFPVWRLAAFPALVLIICLVSNLLLDSPILRTWDAIIVADSVSLRSADGEQFDELFTIAPAQGHRVRTLTTRGQWARIRTSDGHVGWIPAQDIENVLPNR